MARQLRDWIPRPALGGARRLLVACRHLGLREPDLNVLAYPKSGITWLRFMLVQALTHAEVTFDDVRQASPPVGWQAQAPGILPNQGRLLKSHESPRTMWQRSPRVLYLVRDGRDVAVSYYHHRKRRGVAPPTFSEHLEQFLSGTVDNYGAWQDHTMNGAELLRRRQGHVFLLRYEELLAAPEDMLYQVFGFFGWTLDPGAIQRAVAANRPAAMRAKETFSSRLQATSHEQAVPFVRSAKAGGWMETFAGADTERFESLAGRALRFLGYK